MARHVYGLELNDLPLDRLSEQKSKRQRGGVKTDKCETTQQTEHDSLSKSPITNGNFYELRKFYHFIIKFYILYPNIYCNMTIV